MPGYFVATGSLYFLELGYVNSQFQLTGFPNPSVAGVLAIVSTNPSLNQNLSGFRFGVGTNTQVGTHVAVREEYIWEFYNSLTANSNTNAVGPFPNTDFLLNVGRNNSIRVNPTIGKFNLAAVYYFARQGNAPDLNTAPAHVGGHFYGGLNGSYEAINSNAEYGNVLTTGVANNFAATTQGLFKGIMDITGWNVGLFAGYGWNFSNRWYLGGELFGNFDSTNGNTSQTSSGAILTLTNGVPTNTVVTLPYTLTARLQKQWDFGLALIPGYQVSDHALLYGRVGYVGAQFRSTTAMGTGFINGGVNTLTGAQMHS